MGSWKVARSVNSAGSKRSTSRLAAGGQRPPVLQAQAGRRLGGHLLHRGLQGEQPLFPDVFPQEFGEGSVKPGMGHVPAPVEGVGDQGDVREGEHPVHIRLRHALEDDPHPAAAALQQPAEELCLGEALLPGGLLEGEPRQGPVPAAGHRAYYNTVPAD